MYLNLRLLSYLAFYPQQLQKTPDVETLVQIVWALIGSNRLPGIADDVVASPLLLRFTYSDWTSTADVTIVAL